MRVALVASLVSPIVEAEANGPHSVIRDLAHGLSARDHAVAIFAASGSVVPGFEVVQIPVDPIVRRAALRAGGTVDDTAREALRRGFERLFEEVRARRPDVVSQHAFDAPAFELAATLPAVHTLHLPPIDRDVVRAARGCGQPLVAVSEASSRDWRAAGVAQPTVIRNGVSEVAFVPRQPEAFALIAGRVSPEKGTDVAIVAARQAGLTPCVVGDIYDREYFDECVAPLLSPGEDVRSVPRAELLALMSRVAVTVMPVRWEETFGLVAAEAQMAGCPVVGYRRGALPEIVVDGVTGFLVAPDDAAALPAAIAAARELDRGQIVSSARARLGIGPMIDGYERVLTSAAEGARAAWPAPL
jgi:glycosyltransferase involved in cell wall biosynthesis